MNDSSSLNLSSDRKTTIIDYAFKLLRDEAASRGEEFHARAISVDLPILLNRLARGNMLDKIRDALQEDKEMPAPRSQNYRTKILAQLIDKELNLGIYPTSKEKL